MSKTPSAIDVAVGQTAADHVAAAYESHVLRIMMLRKPDGEHIAVPILASGTNKDVNDEAELAVLAMKIGYQPVATCEFIGNGSLRREVDRVVREHATAESTQQAARAHA